MTKITHTHTHTHTHTRTRTRTRARPPARPHAHTHTEYLIHMAFPLQQWLRERTSVLYYTDIACLVKSNSPDFVRQGICV